MITSFVMSTIKYMESNLQRGEVGAILFVVLLVLCATSLVLLVFRRARLRYWKIDDHLRTLEKIDKSLEEIKQNLPEAVTISIGTVENLNQGIHNKASSQETSIDICDDNIDRGTNPLEIFVEKKVIDENDIEAQENKKTDEQEIIKSGYNVGKTGMVYAEELLREQIQF